VVWDVELGGDRVATSWASVFVFVEWALGRIIIVSHTDTGSQARQGTAGGEGAGAGMRDW
jgi:hypothetical protein